MIVAGAKGGADNFKNTTQAELENLESVSDGHFFNNVFRIGGGNGVYIGYKNTINGPVGYALSGIHIGNFSTLNIQSVEYEVTNRTAVDGSDLALYEFTHSQNHMPSLHAIPLAKETPGAGTPGIMIGKGRNRAQDANTPDAVSVTDGKGYTTVSTRLKRWGTNHTAQFTGLGTPSTTHTFNISGHDTVSIQTIFKEPDDGEWLTTNQAQAVAGDSGGGFFTSDGTLIGIMLAVDGSNNAEAAFGNAIFSADIATYKSSIDNLTALPSSLNPAPAPPRPSPPSAAAEPNPSPPSDPADPTPTDSTDPSDPPPSTPHARNAPLHPHTHSRLALQSLNS